MSQFAHKVVVWSIVILLLLLGVFLQVRSARGQAETRLFSGQSATIGLRI